MLEKLYEDRDQEGEGNGEANEEGKEVDDEVFSQQYIPRTLREVYDIERDGDKIQQGQTDDLVYSDLLATNTADPGTASDPEDENDETNSDSGYSDRPAAPPRGKRFEDKDAKKEHKKAVKEEKRERRKEKMPKHVKKKLVSGSGRGKK